MVPDTAAVPAEPRPAASVIIVRAAPAGAAEPIEVYMVRRQRSMKFLGGFYAFPGGKVEAGDAAPAVLDRCWGLDAARAAQSFPRHDGPPPLAFRAAAASARFFVCGLPAGQAPRRYTEGTSGGVWMHRAAGYGRFVGREMAMGEPAEYGLAYIAQFRWVDELWGACEDSREKFTGIVDRIE